MILNYFAFLNLYFLSLIWVQSLLPPECFQHTFPVVIWNNIWNSNKNHMWENVALSRQITLEIPGRCDPETLCVNTWLCGAVTDIDRPPAVVPSFIRFLSVCRRHWSLVEGQIWERRSAPRGNHGELGQMLAPSLSPVAKLCCPLQVGSRPVRPLKTTNPNPRVGDN